MADPKQTHDIDQYIASMRGLAGALGSFYREAIDRGMPSELAADLTVEYLRIVLRGMGGSA